MINLVRRPRYSQVFGAFALVGFAKKHMPKKPVFVLSGKKA